MKVTTEVVSNVVQANPHELRLALHINFLNSAYDKDLVVVQNVEVVPEYNLFPCPYSFLTDYEVPHSLVQIFTVSMYAWDIHTITIVTISGYKAA